MLPQNSPFRTPYQLAGPHYPKAIVTLTCAATTTGTIVAVASGSSEGSGDPLSSGNWGGPWVNAAVTGATIPPLGIIVPGGFTCLMRGRAQTVYVDHNRNIYGNATLFGAVYYGLPSSSGGGSTAQNNNAGLIAGTLACWYCDNA